MCPPVVEIIPTTHAHVAELADNLRVADRAELAASGHADAHRAIEFSVSLSTHLATAVVGDRVGAIFGLVPLSMVTGKGCPWMLGTDLVLTHRRALMRDSPAYLRAMLRAYPHLENLVHAENAFAVRWLKHMGFELHPVAPHPRTGAPFHRFEMKA